MKKILILIGLSTSLSAWAADPITVSSVDVPRYMGKWHEMARLPMRFQDECVRDVQAQYTLNANNTVTVQNSCRRSDGSLITAEGLVKKVNDSGSKLSVTFVPKILRWTGMGKSPYWILRLDENYQTVLVGTPNRKYLWILSRNPEIDAQVYESYVATAKQQGYDVSKLIRNP